MIHVCYGLHDETGRYSKFVGTSMLSMFENHSRPASITVHLLHDDTLTLDNYEKFVYLAGQYNQQIRFYNMEKICAETISAFREVIPTGLSIGATFRLLIFQVLSPQIDKVIYLDADTIVNLDIQELWQIDLGDKPFGGVAEVDNGVNTQQLFAICRDKVVKDEDYINSGVWLMNLAQLRKNKDVIENGVEFIIAHPQYAYFDQDIFNYCFGVQALRLPTKFNRFPIRIKDRTEKAVERNLYHYAGHPLQLNMRDAFNRLYFDYFTKTQWFNADTLGNIFDDVRAIYLERQNIMAIVSAAVASKRRIFVTEPNNVELVRKIFYVKDNEEVLKIDSPNWIGNLIAMMKNSAGEKIYFLLVGDLVYPQLRKMLIKEGFTEWQDFLNGEIFLSELHGVPLDSFRLIYKM